MIDFIDRFADPRYVADKQLRCSAIWVGVVDNDPALVEYLSPDDVDESQFVADAGDDYYDVDFLEAGFGETRPVDAVIDELAGDRNLTAEQTAQLRQAAAERGVTEANAWIILEQHAYEGDATVDFGGLAFLGNVEYREPEPADNVQPVHLFVGDTDRPTVMAVGDYAWDELSGDLGVEASEPRSYGHKVVGHDGWVSIPPRELFELATVRDSIKFTDELPDVVRACEDRGLTRINAFISVQTEDPAPLKLDPAARFAGLQYLGVFHGDLSAW
jgi:hypothetical protein